MSSQNEIERTQAIRALHCPFGQHSGDWANVSRQQLGCVTDGFRGKHLFARSSRWLRCALHIRNFFHCLSLCRVIRELVHSSKESLTIFWRRKRRSEKSDQFLLVFRSRRGPLNHDGRNGTEKSGEMFLDRPEALELFLFLLNIDL